MKRGVFLLIAVLVLGAGWYFWNKNNDGTLLTSTPSSSQLQNKGNYLVIKEWAVKFKLPENIKGKISYFHRDGVEQDSYAINVPAVELENCAPLSIDRVQQPSSEYKKIGEYYYFVVAGAQACDTADSARQQNANRVQEDLKEAITNSLETV